jgi:hypothetical protein
MSKLELINREISEEIAKPEVERALLATTFKGLKPVVMKQAIMEGMMRGFFFNDFIEKNIYAIPFKESYSLVTSIDYARKVGMRSGIIGKSAPQFEEKDGKIVSCTVTVKRKVGVNIGEYSDTVYFAEYYKGGRNGYPSLWDSKPRTMIAKVAEMHALRMACPEELSQAYVEEEMQKETIADREDPLVLIDTTNFKKKMEATTTLKELQKVWSDIPVQAKEALKDLKEELKKKYANA